MNISIIGTGYVGLVSGACFASLNHNVICVDVDEDKITKINTGVSPIYEKGLTQLLQKNRNRIRATSSYEKAVQNSDITFICVGTPSLENGDIDLSYVDQAVKSIASELKNKNSFHSVVVKSTVVPGTTEQHILPLLEKISGKKAGEDFGVGTLEDYRKANVFLNHIEKE
jgi:UDPglucose 6-dehydrogenase